MTAPPTIAIAADAAYLRHAAVTGSSAATADPGAVVHVLAAPDVTVTDLKHFAACVERAGGHAQVHRVDEKLVAELTVMPRIGPVMWYRTLLPSLLPDVGRILYLDADTLVVASLASLFDMTLDGRPLAAVDNVLEPPQRERVARLTGSADGYFNSGVLLLDLAAMREGAWMERVLRTARAERDALQWPDQDALNLVFGPSRLELHPRWNVQNSLYFWGDWARDVFGEQSVRSAIADPAIIHFEGPGPAKPWHRDCEHPWREHYRDLAASTAWGPLRLETTQRGRAISGRARRLFRKRRAP
jgi:lipopolysaccharide biosynthesis glycosyltransferase